MIICMLLLVYIIFITIYMILRLITNNIIDIETQYKVMYKITIAVKQAIMYVNFESLFN